MFLRQLTSSNATKQKKKKENYTFKNFEEKYTTNLIDIDCDLW